MNILLEQLLMSEFTFGFELEAYVDPYKIPLKNNEKWENIKHFPTNKVITYIDKPSLFKNLEYFFKSNFFGINSNLTVEEDNSLKYNGFEMQSLLIQIKKQKFDILLINSPFRISIYPDVYEEFELLCRLYNVRVLSYIDYITEQ